MTTQHRPQTAANPSGPVRVWDIWVRLFHWNLVAVVATAAATGFLGGALWLRLHITAGLAAGALVLARIVWGLFGSTHARFVDFLPSPRTVLAHLRGGGHRHLGHNPLGALMVLALFAFVLALAVTGIGLLGGLLRVGPLAPDLGTAAGFALRGWHETLAIALLILVALHLAGVAFESRRAHENLARSMVTGTKPRREGDVPARPARTRGLAALVTIALAGGGLALANAQLTDRPVPGLPTAEILPIVADECGACHMVYPPALLPAASWAAITATLDNHFGEDASLGDAATAEIGAWLAANAADTVDTKPARLFARAPAEPVAITELAAWKRLHADLPDAVFAARPVGARSNCIACHADAETGRFSPFAISIPKERTQ